MNKQNQQTIDEKYMNKALELALNGVQKTSPNPLVGCVIVKNGKIIGQGWHHYYGGDHAEVDAVKNCTESIEGAVVYVTLEPCSHYGKTPPCADMLVKNKPARVVVGMMDPNPKVNGQGIEKLKNAGIDVTVGVLEEKCKYVNRGFLRRILYKRPWVVIKAASSLDGKIALNDGSSQWITGEAARLKGQELRACSDAVLTGVGTVLADNPQYTVRSIQDRNPVKVVLDSELRITEDSKIFDDGTVIVITTNRAKKELIEKISKKCAKILYVNYDNGCKISDVLDILYEEGFSYLLVEAGAAITSSFLKSGFADEINLFMAPKIIGRGLSYSDNVEFENLGEAITFKSVELFECGNDFLFKGVLKCSPDL